MRKHNRVFARRWSRSKRDRSNFPQSMAHSFTNDKAVQIFSNRLLQTLLFRAGLKPLAVGEVPA